MTASTPKRSSDPADPGPSPAERPRYSWLQIACLLGTLAIAGVVGTWAYFLPREFYDHFPVVLGEWISRDGPYNEHLIRDHGAQYLALGAASALALRWQEQRLLRVLGVAWTLFGVLHFAYHVSHLGHMTAGEALAMLTVLAIAALLGAGLVLAPGRRCVDG